MSDMQSEHDQIMIRAGVSMRKNTNLVTFESAEGEGETVENYMLGKECQDVVSLYLEH